MLVLSDNYAFFEDTLYEYLSCYTGKGADICLYIPLQPDIRQHIFCTRRITSVFARTLTCRPLYSNVLLTQSSASLSNVIIHRTDYRTRTKPHNVISSYVTLMLTKTRQGTLAYDDNADPLFFSVSICRLKFYSRHRTFFLSRFFSATDWSLFVVHG